MSGPTEQIPNFSILRNFFWPIRGCEVKKFLPMACMMFFVLFNYTLLRNTKDALVVTSTGPEIIPFLKGVVIMPISILFVTLYAKLTNIIKPEHLFYLGVSTFLLFFSVFALVLYPNQEALEPSPELITYLKATYPYVQHIFPIFGKWVFSSFYVFSELWGTIVLGLLFWQFANEITRTYEAKRFYSMFAFLAHFALIIAGATAKYLCQLQKAVPMGLGGCSQFLNSIVVLVLIGGIAIMAIYRWINKAVLTNPLYYDAAQSQARKREQKPKFTVSESFKHVFGSKYIGLIAILVMGYGIANNILGVIWKKQLKLQYSNFEEYFGFMGNFSMATGFITVVLIFFLKGVVPKFGWLRGAIVTPLVLTITGGLFLTFVLFNEALTPVLAVFGLTPLMMAVWIGSSQQVLSKSSKYSMFDPTKEMAYIPLDQDLKVRGKAAVDVIGHSFSKASGGYIVGGLLVLTAASDLMSIVPYLAAIVLGIIAIWILAVSKLHKLYLNLISTRHVTSLQQDRVETDQEMNAVNTAS